MGLIFSAQQNNLTITYKTPLKFWCIPFSTIIFLYLLRLPRTIETAVQEAEQKFADTSDPALINLAVTIAAYISIIVIIFVVAVYFVLASLINKHIYPNGFLLWKNYSIGYFFVIATLSTVTPHILITLFGLLKPQELPFIWVCPFAIAIATLAIYYPSWKEIPFRKKMSLSILSIIFSWLPLAT